jgi:hypothetical protein
MHLWFPQGVHYGNIVAPIIPGNCLVTYHSLDRPQHHWTAVKLWCLPINLFIYFCIL